MLYINLWLVVFELHIVAFNWNRNYQKVNDFISKSKVNTRMYRFDSNLFINIIWNSNTNLNCWQQVQQIHWQQATLIFLSFHPVYQKTLEQVNFIGKMDTWRSSHSTLKGDSTYYLLERDFNGNLFENPLKYWYNEYFSLFGAVFSTDRPGRWNKGSVRHSVLN